MAPFFEQRNVSIIIPQVIKTKTRVQIYPFMIKQGWSSLIQSVEIYLPLAIKFNGIIMIV